MSDALYIIGTAIQVAAYLTGRVSMTVACLAGVVYWLALLAAWKMGSLR